MALKVVASWLNIGNVNENEEDDDVLAKSQPTLFKQGNEQSRRYSNGSNRSNRSNRSNTPNKPNKPTKPNKKNRRHNSGSTNSNSSVFSTKDISSNKICIGDKIKLNYLNQKTEKQHKELKGVVMYIGYPYITKGVRYGINLDKANGEHAGALMLDIKTGKLARPSHVEKYKKRIKKRKFFKAKTNHGIFIKKDRITSIDRMSTALHRFTVNDDVEVRFRGIGKIKFIGALEHTKEMGVWYGIHLIERRGRHDGTVNGVKYFECPPQYGLHCRQNHLTLIDENENKQFEETKSNSDDDDLQSNLYLNSNINSTSRTRNSSLASGKEKHQKSVKWAKIMGVKDPTSIKGFKPTQRGKSTMTLRVPGLLVRDDSESQPDAPDLPLKLSLSSNKQNIAMVRDLNKMVSISNIMPPDAFRPTLSVHILPGVHETKSIDDSKEVDRSKHNSIKGKTTVVLPGYHDKIKKRKFFDYFDFDEIEDELGEGEFGIVYKCRKIEIEDSNEYSTTITFHTETMRTKKMKSYDSVSDYPGKDYDSDVSYSNSSADEDETVYAVKKIKKAKFHHLTYQDKQKAIKLLQQEIKLLEKIQRYKHKKLSGSHYVIDLIDVFEDRNYLYIVTNFCSGGNLWQYIEDENDEDHSEQRIQSIMKQILEGLVFLHNNNMAHLDIKPDNIMFNENKQIQLIDFGMSSVIPALTKKNLLVGTPNFVAPEVIDGFYDKKADIWSVGVIFFMLRFGYPPFYQGNKPTEDSGVTNLGEHKALFDLIKKGFNPIVKKGLGAWFPLETPVSEELKDLLGKMLDSDLSNRYTAAECLAHPYFKTLADAKKLPLTILNAFTKFSGQCRFKVMIARLFSKEIEPKQMKLLSEIWQKFDVDGDGSLTLEQFKKVMNEYDTGYKDYQIEAIFENLDWNETDTINFDALVTAFSYQRLVAVDERLWEAFARLDVDNDGHITKAEIKRCLAMVNPSAFDNGIKQLEEFKAVGDVNINPNPTEKLSAEDRRKKNISFFIGDCIGYADWDDDGQIDYEEFLRALHPTFNEENITPRTLQTPSTSAPQKSFIFEPSIGNGRVLNINPDDKHVYDNYRNTKMDDLSD